MEVWLQFVDLIVKEVSPSSLTVFPLMLNQECNEITESKSTNLVDDQHGRPLYTLSILYLGQANWDDIKILGTCSMSICQNVCLCVSGKIGTLGVSFKLYCV